MTNIAFIPVRGGSKSIIKKNIKTLAGKPLVYWTAKAASDANCIDKVIVATDCEVIKKVVLDLKISKVEIYDRDPVNAQDTSSTESVMLEYLKKTPLKNDDFFFLIQATSPMLQAEHIEEMFENLIASKKDSALSCVRNKRFYWNEEGSPINYDYMKRPRRQDFAGMLMENGACYINSVGNIIESGNRLSKKIAVYEMPEYTATEIDEPDDWIILENLMYKYITSKEKQHSYKMFLTDCDGCLTDAGMYYSEKGDELKKFNTKDGKGFELLRNAGFITGIITSETTDIVTNRAKKLKLNEVHMGIKNKLEVVKNLSKKYNIPLSEIVYVGDDINDLEVIQTVGLGCAVNDAMKAIITSAKFVSRRRGGDGAVREIIDHVLQLINYQS